MTFSSKDSIICGPVNKSQVPKYLVETIYAGFC